MEGRGGEGKERDEGRRGEGKGRREVGEGRGGRGKGEGNGRGGGKESRNTPSIDSCLRPCDKYSSNLDIIYNFRAKMQGTGRRREATVKGKVKRPLSLRQLRSKCFTIIPHNTRRDNRKTNEIKIHYST